MLKDFFSHIPESYQVDLQSLQERITHDNYLQLILHTAANVAELRPQALESVLRMVYESGAIGDQLRSAAAIVGLAHINSLYKDSEK